MGEILLQMLCNHETIFLNFVTSLYQSRHKIQIVGTFRKILYIREGKETNHFVTLKWEALGEWEYTDIRKRAIWR